MKVWLDDVRAPYNFGRLGWRWVKTGEGAIELLERGGVKAISLDHDLAPEHYAGEHAKEINGAKTGLDVVKWMCAHRVFPAKIYLHSMNPVGRANMEAEFNALGVSYEIQIAKARL